MRSFFARLGLGTLALLLAHTLPANAFTVTTLGMGPDEMKEIAAVVALVLNATTPKTIQKGKKKGQPSRAGFTQDEAVCDEARGRIKTLLASYPLYPELDLDILLGAIREE